WAVTGEEESSHRAAVGHASPTSAPHPMLDAVEPSLRGARFNKSLDGSEFYLSGHLVAGRPTMPGVAYLEMVRAAARLCGFEAVGGWRKVAWLAPAAVAPGGLKLHVALEEGAGTAGAGELSFEVSSGGGKERLVHARGRVLRADDVAASGPEILDIAAVEARCQVRLGREQVYGLMAAQGVTYGPRFQRVASLACSAHESLALLDVDEETRAELSLLELHPAVVDAALQCAMGIFYAGGASGAMLPYALERLRLAGDIAGARYAYVRGREGSGAGAVSFDILLCDADGRVLLSAEELTLRAPKPPARQTAVRAPLTAATEAVEHYLRASAPPEREEHGAFTRFEELCRLRLLAVFQSQDLFTRAGETHDLESLRRRLRLAPKYDRLLAAFLDILKRLGAVTSDAGLVTATGLVEEPLFQEKLARIPRLAEELSEENRAVEPHLRLLDACFNRYASILRGEVPATEVFFPKGSMELVEGIYRGYALADYFHRLMAWAVRSAAEDLCAGGGAVVRVLEVGAGTGGTSAHVFESLKDCGARLEYFYTDLSA
ncbi:MAG TPA: polyketide synthase dehydratase domain-containing protein, partial [Pyrinomonadaceae bacterium]